MFGTAMRDRDRDKRWQNGARAAQRQCASATIAHGVPLVARRRADSCGRTR
jgi:hypothetical protein